MALILSERLMICKMYLRMTWKQKHLVYVLAWFILCFQHALGNPCSKIKGDYYDGKCFKIFWEELDYDQAKEMCKNWMTGGRLAELRTDSQFMFLRMVALRDNTDSSAEGIFVAGRRETPTADLTWPDGQPVTLSYWLGNNPNNDAQKEHCLELKDSGVFLLNDVQCSKLRYYACEYNIGDSCESYMSDSEYFHGQCYKIYQEPADWSDAISICAQDGAFLAEPKTDNMYDFLTKFINVNVGLDEINQYLIGLTDSQQEGEFRWLSDNEILTLNRWKTGEPNGNRGENQVLIFSQENTIRDYNAEKTPYPFICQKDVLTHTYMAVVSTDGNKNLTDATLTITALDPGVTFVRVTQADGLRAESTRVYTEYEVVKLLNQGTYLVLEEFCWITSSGISSEFVEVKSTNPVTVLMYSSFYETPSRLTDIAGTLVLPTDMLRQNYFVLSHSTPSMEGILTVTAIEDNTDVTIKMSSQVSQELVTIGRIEVYKINYFTVSLSKYETILIETSDIAGCFVYGSRPVAVFTKTTQITSSDVILSSISVDMLIPSDYMDTRYVTFPVWYGNSLGADAQSVDKIQLLALQDNTVVQIHDENNQTVSLAQTGDFINVSFSTSEFYLLESKVPFHASRLSSDEGVGCTSQLVPSSLWRTEYSVMSEVVPLYMDITVLFIIAEQNSFNYTFQAQSEDCQLIKDTDLYGCIIERVVFPPIHEVYTISSSAPFVVYQAGVNESGRTRSCFPWGINSLGVPDIVVDFDGRAYVNQSELSCIYPTTATNDLITTVIDEVTTTFSSNNPTTELNIPAETEKFKAHIEEELYIETTDTSAYKRSKICIPDPRVSSTVIGLFGAGLLAATFGLFVLADITRFYSFLCVKMKDKHEEE